MRHFMRKALALVALLALPTLACAQSTPGLFNGQVPSAAQWNSYFAAKQDYPVPVFTPTINGSVPAPGTPVGNCLLDNATWGTCGSGGGGTPANPTATIGATAVNGVATTYMRSDAAPALPATMPALNGSLLTNLNPANLSVAVAVAKGGTGCTSAAVSCITAIGGLTGTPSSSTFLRGDGQWATPAGSGNVSGPGSAVSANLASFNGTSGTIIQDSGISTASVVTLTGSQTLTNKSIVATQLTGTLQAAQFPALTGDITTSAGALATTLTTVNANVGSFTNANITVNAKGLITAAANGSSSGVSVTSLSPNLVVTPSPGTGTFTLGVTYAINAQTGTTYTVVSTDLGKLVTFSNASSIAVTLPQATSTFGAGASLDVQNKGAGAVTITPTTSTINGAASLVLNQNTGCTLVSDGTNWQVSSCNAIGGGSVTLAGNNVWTGQNSSTPVALTISTATFTPTGATNHYTIGLTSACPCTLANPSATPVAGTEGTFKITQDGTGSRTITTWGSMYQIEGGTSAIALSTAANAHDLFAYHVIDATHIDLTFASKNPTH